MKVEIPDRHQDFCRALAKLARKHGVSEFSGTYRPGFKDEWRHEISFKWSSGRHEEDVGKISIWSSLYVVTHVDGVK